MIDGRGVLVLTGEPVGARMAGPAIRAYELGRVLAEAGATVTLVAPPGEGELPVPPRLRRAPLRRKELAAQARDHDCIFMGGGLLARFPMIAGSDRPLAIDLSAPTAFEAAELFRDAPPGLLQATMREASANLGLEVRRADLLVCASERQRDLWTGALVATGRLDRALYTSDPSLDNFCRVIPYGVPAEAPRPAAPVVRGRVPGIGEDDLVVLWAGGIYQWLDPEVAVEAAALLAERLPSLRLVFMGVDPPNPGLQRHALVERARALAERLGVLDRHVFFLPGWVPYQDRGALLAEADLGISTSRRIVETRYSWRSRLLDYLWVGLPVVCTAGDDLGDLLAVEGAARTVPAGDPRGLADAIGALVQDGPERDAMKRRAATLAERFRWPRVAAPLVDWVANPSSTGARVPRWSARVALTRMYVAKARFVFRQEGLQGIRRRMRRFG